MALSSLAAWHADKIFFCSFSGRLDDSMASTAGKMWLWLVAQCLVGAEVFYGPPCPPPKETWNFKLDLQMDSVKSFVMLVVCIWMYLAIATSGSIEPYEQDTLWTCLRPNQRPIKRCTQNITKPWMVHTRNNKLWHHTILGMTIWKHCFRTNFSF